MSPYFYITTPIYYVNAAPHLGTLYTTIAADVIARFMRLDGYTVKFVTGTDEHGQKIERAAADAAADGTQVFVDAMAAKFEQLFSQANISHSDFIRTTQDRHKRGAIALWNKLKSNGHIRLGEYAGWYSVRDESFYSESELIDGKAPTGAPVEWVSEASYFFDMSSWQEQLLQLYESNSNFIMPRWRANEVINMVRAGLPDLSISRTAFKWGIPVPGDPDHVMYVWLDALANYLSVLGYPDINTEDFKNFWPADMHLVGKDITKFHAIYWPAILMAAGLPLPKKIVSHGWWTVKGQKMSKSLKNVVDPVALIGNYGADSVRYYLMREISFGVDGEFAEENLVLRANSELSNKIGNLLQRTLVLTYKNCDKQIPSVNVQELYATSSILQLAAGLLGRIKAELVEVRLSHMIEHVISFADLLNAYIDKSEPWKLSRTHEAKMREVLYVTLESLRYMAILLQPFVPESAGKILNQLGVPKSARTFDKLTADYALKSGIVLEEPHVVFPRIDTVLSTFADTFPK